MNKRIASILFASLCGGLVLANPPEAPSTDPSVIGTIKQIEQDLGDALVAADVNSLNQILADDWKSIGISGKVHTKESALRDVKSGKDKLESFENGPMDVQVFGNVAVSHGSVSEKRSRDGKDDSGVFVWMDLLEKRGDKWVIVRSAGARVR
jgi:ketosteroid isomerase-like protein